MLVSVVTTLGTFWTNPHLMEHLKNSHPSQENDYSNLNSLNSVASVKTFFCKCLRKVKRKCDSRVSVSLYLFSSCSHFSPSVSLSLSPSLSLSFSPHHLSRPLSHRQTVTGHCSKLRFSVRSSGWIKVQTSPCVLGHKHRISKTRQRECLWFLISGHSESGGQTYWDLWFPLFAVFHSGILHNKI